MLAARFSKALNPKSPVKKIRFLFFEKELIESENSSLIDPTALKRLYIFLRLKEDNAIPFYFP